MPEKGQEKSKAWSHIKLLFFLGFVLALSNAITAYIHSSYISQFVGEKNVGLVFTAAYVLAFLAVNNFAKAINWLKVFKTAVAILGVMILSLVFLSVSFNPWLAVASFVVYLVLLDLLWIMMDIYVEHFSRDQMTGRIRGLYWTFVNIAWLCSPLTSGFLLRWFNYSFLFFISLILVIAALVIFYLRLRKLEFDHFPKPRWWQAVKTVMQNRNLRNIFFIAFLLQVFYCAMIIYAPLYLHEYVGFSWEKIGVIFAVMLVNFVIWTYPAGWLADKYFGEKEILMAGFLVMGAFTLAFGLITSSDFWLWLIILFFTRVGASLVDIMRDTYFFKRVDAQDVSVINIFRNTTALAYILTPLFATAILYLFGYQAFFVLIGVIVLSGAYFAFRIGDTR